ncbi:MAG TPA: helix-turn-helix domain-containing protein [Bryobacteraceae bacterium]|nr:helix-turn-helix domain-containing protein [Bryobacteraceae bacterium]
MPELKAYVVGQPFNPWRKTCGFYPPDRVGRETSLTDGPKRLYERLVRYAGQDGDSYPKHERLAADLGKSKRQVRYDLEKLRVMGLIAWEPRGGRGSVNTYTFLWHPLIERQFIAGLPESERHMSGSPLPAAPATLSSDCLSRPARYDDSSGNPLPPNSVQEINTGEDRHHRQQYRGEETVETPTAERNDEESRLPPKGSNPNPDHGALNVEPVGLKQQLPTEQDLTLLGEYMRRHLPHGYHRPWNDKSRSLQFYPPPPPPPRFHVLRCLKAARGWSVPQLLARLEQNKTIKRGEPETYSWFEPTIADVYKRCDGVPPTEEEIQQILKHDMRTRAGDGTSTKHADMELPDLCRHWIDQRQKQAYCLLLRGGR